MFEMTDRTKPIERKTFKKRKKFLTKRAGSDIINKLPRERDAQDLEN